MANSREVKIIENEFLEFEKKNENIFFEVKLDEKLLDTKRRQKTSDSFSLFFKNLDKEVSLKLKKNSNIKINGFGILNIIVEEDLDLELNFISKEFENIFVNIIVKENKKLNLIDFTNSEFLYKKIKINLEKNSKLNYSQFILNSKISHSNIILNENSNYKLNSVYFADNLNNYILNKATHFGKNSKSNLEVNGLAKENSKIINDILVTIEKSAKNSTAHQKMKNLILYNTSQIQSEPILEVKNNNVVCSHASSISQISKDILYYINSRGISKPDAIKLISNSYFELVLSSINDVKLRSKYEKLFEIY